MKTLIIILLLLNCVTIYYFSLTQEEYIRAVYKNAYLRGALNVVENGGLYNIDKWRVDSLNMEELYLNKLK